MQVQVIHGVFAPCGYKGHQFIDGGVLNNVPADALQAIGEKKVLAVKFPPGNQDRIRNVYDVVFKAIDVMFDDRDNTTIHKNNLIVDIPLIDAKVFNIRKLDYCYHVGYATTKENIGKIREYLETLDK